MPDDEGPADDAGPFRDLAPPLALAVDEPYVVIQLMGPPRGKGRPRFGRRGAFTAVFTDKNTMAYENALKAAGIAAMEGKAVLDEPVSVIIRAYMPIPASFSKLKRMNALNGDLMPTTMPDLDNICKMVDGLNHHPPLHKGDKEKRPIIWRNDSLIVSMQAMKLYSELPRLEIVVSRWG